MALFLIPRTQAESGVLAKIRPAHTRVKDVYGKTEREYYSHTVTVKFYVRHFQ